MVTHTTTQADERAIYPAYQPSGLEWLGEIPVGWDIWKATHAFGHIGSGTTPKSDNYEYYDGQIPWVTTSELRETRIDDTLNKITAEALRDYPALRLYPAGTLLFAMYGATIGRLGILKIPATVNQACAAFSEPIKLDPKFTYYWLYMRRPILIALSAGGGQPNLSQDDLKQLRIPAPPLEEQLTIADYLDRETTRIDALIEKKQRQIELLQEKRTALISHAVTKGLNPNAKMKDSGVEWLGNVPSSWRVMRLRFCATINPTPAEIKGVTSDTIVSFVPMEAIRENGGLNLEQTRPLERVAQGYTYFRDNDVIVAKITPCFENGKGSLANGLKSGIGFGTTELHVFRPFSRLDGKYLFYLTLSHAFRKIGASYMYGAGGQKRVPDDFIQNFRLTIPLPSEQRAIAAFLDHETARIDSLTEKVEKSITLLREYRTSLISAAVTGKIDVRKEAA